VLLVFLWPARWAASPVVRRRLLLSTAAGLAVVAAALVLLVPADGADAPGPTRTAALESGDTATLTLGTVNGGSRPLTVTSGVGTTTVDLVPAGQQVVDGLVVDVWQAKVPTAPDQTANPVTLGQLATLTGGRLPVGLSANVTPGPFQAEWAANVEYNVLAAGEALISADAESTRIVTLQGGGLPTAKTVSAGSLGTDWSISEEEASGAAQALADATLDRSERTLWRVWVPAVLVLAAVAMAVTAVARGRTTPEINRKEETAVC
jgi:high-affinity iron transporter